MSELPTTIRCISLHEPYATLWLTEGAKLFETRPFNTPYRGPLLVHAAKNTKYRHLIGSNLFREHLAEAGVHEWTDFHLGCIIGCVQLIGCCKTQTARGQSELTAHEEYFGDWTNDRFAWERAPKPEVFMHPIPYRGQQGFFNVPVSVLRAAGVNVQAVKLA